MVDGETRFKTRARAPGFTLMEAALAIVIVGTGVVAAMTLFSACMAQNRFASRLTVATMLARHIEETMVRLSFEDPTFPGGTKGPELGESLADFDDLDDFHGFNTTSLAGPIDALRRPVPELSKYSQHVNVTHVASSDLTTPGSNTGAVRVEVTIRFRERPGQDPRAIYSTSWYRTR